MCSQGVIHAQFFAVKDLFFSSNPLENKPINSTPLIHKFSFKMKMFKRKETTWSFKEGVSPHP